MSAVRSVEQEDRNFAQPDHLGGGGSDNQPADAGMAIGTHNEQIDIIGFDGAGDQQVGWSLNDIRLDVMTGRFKSGFRARQAIAVFGRLGTGCQQADRESVK